MRIVGGQWRGRPLKAPAGSRTRPTTDRVREALFSALAARLGTDLSEAVVLDAFAGSGALGLEALSRGARSAVFVEDDRRALAALRANVGALGATDRCRVLSANLFTLAERGFHERFSLILLDPPYTLDAARVSTVLARLARAGSVVPGAVVSWEHRDDADAVWPDGYEPDARKRYGSIEIEIAVFGRGDAS
jgi:16S rRNA (guanine966-N2)-methyltransferase